MRDDYKEIYLDNTSHHIAVSVAVYEQVKTIVEQNRICVFCLTRYTDTNPQVAENVCLGCFRKHRTNTPTNLTFVCEVESEYAKRYGYQIFKFMDSQGYIYVTNSHNKLNASMEVSILETLLHYGFRVPKQHRLKDDTTIDLESYSWRSIRGDFQTSPVVLVVYRENYGHHLDLVFLLYRDGEPLEFSKRKNPTRQWYLETKAAIEATYTKNEGYVVGTGLDGYDRTAYHLEDYHLYPGIVERAVAAYRKAHSHEQKGASLWQS